MLGIRSRAKNIVDDLKNKATHLHRKLSPHLCQQSFLDGSLEVIHTKSEESAEPSLEIESLLEEDRVPFDREVPLHQLKEDISIGNSGENDIAVIGMSGIFPGADNLEIFWNNLIAGKNVLQEIPKYRWDWKAFGAEILDKNTDKNQIKWGGLVENILQY